jgi:endonuclease/exonuclease/phosphatase (EEP) superfamily protein YafD
MTKRGKRLLGALGCALMSALVSWSALADQTLRVATWNIQTVGTPGSLEFTSAAAVLARLDADIVALQEVASDTDVGALSSLASAVGYPYSCGSGPHPSSHSTDRLTISRAISCRPTSAWQAVRKAFASSPPTGNRAAPIRMSSGAR